MKDWVYDTSPTVNMTFSQAMAHTPREDLVFFTLHLGWSALVWVAVRLYFRLRVSAPRNLPRHRFVVVANHASHADELVMQSALPFRVVGRVFPVVAEDYFFNKPLKSLLSAAVLNAVPIGRADDAQAGLKACRKLLDAGLVLILFPEGTRSRTGEMGQFRKGIGWLLAGTDIQAVPAHINGAHDAWPKGGRFPLPKRISVNVGEPVDFRSVSRDREGFEAVASELSLKVAQLGESGRESR